MATIQENLQTIADSTSAIKQAIIDKGGDVTGDITTWADAILNIPVASTPTIVDNIISYSSSGCTSQFPVASDLTINVLGRQVSDAASSVPHSFDIYIPKGSSTSTATRTIFDINSITPESDNTYRYVVGQLGDPE